MSLSDLSARLQAALGDAYRIERELDGGAMSRLFIAKESFLHRRVVVRRPGRRWHASRQSPSGDAVADD
jgi:hypothetical protein